jgi:hypothetical protein
MAENPDDLGFDNNLIITPRLQSTKELISWTSIKLIVFLYARDFKE